jgi:hypothetical protein
VSLLSAFAAELEFSAAVDRTRVGLGEQLVLTVTVSGSGIGRVPQPKLPSLDGFDRLGSTSSSSSNISFVNGRMSQENRTSFIYYLAPNREGDLIIPPCTLDFKSSIYTTRPIDVTVSKEPQAPPPRQQPPDPFGMFAPPSRSAPQSGSVRDDVHLLAWADRTDVYQGEQVNVNYTFYTRLQVANLNLAQPPSFTGFWVEKLFDAQDLDYQRREYNGRQYDAAAIKRVALFPTRPGELEVGPMRLSGAAVRSGGFFFNTTEPFEVASSAIAISVRPLPDSGVPAGFTGGVGSFEVAAELDNDSSVGGEPVNLTIRVSGTGNIQLVGEPELPRVSAVKALNPETRDKVSRSGGSVSGTREFVYPLIPQADGRHVIPGIELGFFDPKAGSYYTQATPRLEFTATGARPTVPPGEEETGMRVLSTDIRHIKPAGSIRPVAGGWSANPPWWAWLCYPLGLVLLLAGVFVGRHRSKLEQDRGYARLRRSSRLVRKRLARANARLKSGQERGFHAELAGAVQGYVGDRFDIEAQGMTGDEVAAELTRRGVDDATARELLALLRDCDTARFSPGMAECRPQEMLERARRLLESL